MMPAPIGFPPWWTTSPAGAYCIRIDGGAADGFQHRLGAGKNAAVIVAAPEPRQHDLGFDQLRLRVRELAFDAVADFDAHLAFVRRDIDDDAVVLALLPDLPIAAELIAVIVDVVALQGFERGDDDLIARLLLFLREHGSELRLRVVREDAGIVDDASGKCRKRRRRRGRQGDEEKPGRGEKDKSHCAAHGFQNFTCGTSCAFSLMVKVWRSLRFG